MTGPLLVHAVLHADGRPAPDMASPVPGAMLAYVVEAGLAALVSRLPVGSGDELFADPETAAALSLAHHELLTRLSDRADLAPVRLGAVCESDASAAALLRDQADAFRAALARIAGAREFAVKVSPLPAAETQSVIEAPATGRSFLQRRAEAAQHQRNQAEAARAAATAAFDALRAHSSAHAFAPPRRNAAADQEKRLVDAALLVPRLATDAFAAAVMTAQESAAAAGYRLTVRGPLPAYSFVGEAA